MAKTIPKTLQQPKITHGHQLSDANAEIKHIPRSNTGLSVSKVLNNEGPVVL